MTYIYDIIVNFQNNYYQFFEWLPKDKIININKISLYRVSDQNLLYLKENIIKVDEKLIKKIKEDNKRHKKIMCIVSNGKNALALLFDKKGYLIKRSSLIFEEEEEAINLIKNINEITIKFKKNKSNHYQNKLRIEKEKKETIISYIKNTKDLLKLKYLYLECYEKELNDLILIKKALLEELSKDWNNKQKKIYNIIDLLIKN
ncbi:MAG: hypothetical protein IKF19_00405 [Bacilli bacterium]|nr:hypothetical protein [Bacilli bacterium]